MTKYVLTVLVAGLLLGGDEKDDAKKDREALQGTWKVVSGEQGGKAHEAAKNLVMVFEEDTFAIREQDDVIVNGTFKLNPSKSPKAIDMTITKSKDGQDKGKEMHGIYELDKARLKLCTAEPGGKDRPKAFSTKEGTRELLVTLKKDKP